MCIDFFSDKEHSKISSAFSNQILGNNRKRPFSFNEITKLFEPR